MPTTIKYGAFDSCPTRYTDHEAWIFANGKWRNLPPGEVLTEVRPMTQSEFEKDFGEIPALPSAAFHSAG